VKKDLAILFGITGNWAFALANTLIGLKKHSSELLKKSDIFVYYDTLSLKNRLALKKIAPVKFIKYKFPYPHILSKIYNLDRFTHMCFACYEGFNLIKNYKKVLFMDVDILIQKDISNLFDFQEDIYIGFAEKIILKNFIDDIQGYDIDPNGYSFSTGTFLLNNSLLKFEDLAKQCYEKILEYAPVLKNIDQGPIALVLNSHDIKYKNLDELYIYEPSKENWGNAYILHPYLAGKKFWNGIYNKEWEENNIIWLKLGGVAYDPNWDYARTPDFIRQPRKWVKDLKKRYIT